jgi:hypothetical protein
MVSASNHVCKTCGGGFTVTPAVIPEKADQWENCLAWQCPSYTPTRDVEFLGLGSLIRDEPQP